ncbi:hypothetical protein SteCoe_20606 [Stentor coeruleus]|uniref:Uncharacterized protein n=1 Tax=Stentor coeruleus TaxID=5963 RepID=A0A1R2BRS9_9CILI|nr:hypothetical protein SteCoe_20606 [Stentor coeruleus]
MKNTFNYSLSGIFKMCCTKVTCEEETSQEIELPTPPHSRPRGENSFHFTPEALCQQHMDKKFYLEKLNN